MNTPVTPSTATKPNSPAVNPFGRPVSTQCSQRVFHPADGHMGTDGFGPAHTAACDIAPQGRGGHCIEYAKPAGHSIALMFEVTADNQHADFFEFAKDLNKTQAIPMNAYLTSTDGRVLGFFSGRDTDTDQPHCWYVVEGAPVVSNRVAKLPIGRYFYIIDTPDGSAAKMAVWHNGTNHVN